MLLPRRLAAAALRPRCSRPAATDCPFTVLGVRRDATALELKEAYRAKARQHHPDVAGSLSGEMARISEAFQLLSDPIRRAQLERDPVQDARQAAATALALVRAGHEMEAMELLIATAALRHHPSAAEAASAALESCAHGAHSVQRAGQVRSRQLWEALQAAHIGGMGQVDSRACNAFFAIAVRASDFKAAMGAHKHAERFNLEQSAAMKSYVRQAKRYAQSLKENGRGLEDQDGG